MVHDVRFETNSLEAYNPVLVWDHEPADPTRDADAATFRVFRDGELEQTIIGAKRAVVAGIRPDTIVDYQVESVTPFEASSTVATRGFEINQLGNRAEISWATCQTTDFEAYLLYWDAGLGASPATLIETIYGRENTRTISPELTDGTTYQFALARRDLVGNVSSIGTAYSITADAPPVAMTSVTMTYDSATRKATISAAHSPSQHSDIGGVALFDNNIPGTSVMGQYPNVDRAFQKQFKYVTSPGATCSFTTPELWEGQWRFAVRAVDKHGNMSAYSILSRNLILTGSTLGAGSITPLIPENLVAFPTANAGIVLTWDHAGANTTSFRVYSGATVVSTVTGSLTTTPHTKTVTGLTNAVRYYFSISARNGSIESGTSNVATATADSTAPTGSNLLTVALIR